MTSSSPLSDLLARRDRLQQELVEVNEAIGAARAVGLPAEDAGEGQTPEGTSGEKGGSAPSSPGRSRPRSTG